ncbi:HAMP domain-containing histidine kinase [bacterium]|nr:HAMP domain-containing histidine kinase [bacterium]
MKNKFLIFLPLLFSIAVFIFVCLNFTNSTILGGAIEKESSFFADIGSFKAELDSLDGFIQVYEKSEDSTVLNEFIQENFRSLSRDAAFIKEEHGEHISAKIADFAEKIAENGERLQETSAEERPMIISALRSDISRLKDLTDLAARQKLGVLKGSYFMWQDFINKTVLTISSIFLLITLVITFLLVGKSRKISKFAALIGIEDNASVDVAAEEIKKLTDAKNAEFDELGKKFAREQIVGKRKEDLLNAIPEGLLTASAGSVTFVNKTMKEWFGVDGSSIGEEVKNIFTRIGTDGSEGKFINGEETYQLLVSQGQNETFYIIRNITKSEELSSKLLNSERLASIGEMAARITHEIRNPLNTIKMNSTYLLDNVGKTDPEKKQQLLSLVVNEVERLEQITNKYMGMVNYNKNGATESGVSLPADLIEFLSFHLPELQKRNIELSVGKGGEQLSISLSTSSFKEIMLNLLKNAWEELENGGKIAVNIAKNGSFAVISVEDSGRGIPQSERETIFKNFYTKKPGGTGIGLSHSRKLATEAGGKLYAGDSALGGAAFILEIPLKRK